VVVSRLTTIGATSPRGRDEPARGPPQFLQHIGIGHRIKLVGVHHHQQPQVAHIPEAAGHRPNGGLATAAAVTRRTGKPSPTSSTHSRRRKPILTGI
jgi:hypothetical protein